MAPWIFWNVLCLLAFIGWAFMISSSYVAYRKETFEDFGHDYDYDNEIRNIILYVYLLLLHVLPIVGLYTYFILVVNAMRVEIKRESAQEDFNEVDLGGAVEDHQEDLNEIDLEDLEALDAPSPGYISLTSPKQVQVGEKA